jgi:hypothetical protein
MKPVNDNAPAVRKLREYLAGRDKPCPKCGFNLRNLQTVCCPECGMVLAVEILNPPKAGRRLPRWTLGRVALVLVCVLAAANVAMALVLVARPLGPNVRGGPVGSVLLNLLALAIGFAHWRVCKRWEEDNLLSRTGIDLLFAVAAFGAVWTSGFV